MSGIVWRCFPVVETQLQTILICGKDSGPRSVSESSELDCVHRAGLANAVCEQRCHHRNRSLGVGAKCLRGAPSLATPPAGSAAPQQLRLLAESARICAHLLRAHSSPGRRFGLGRMSGARLTKTVYVGDSAVHALGRCPKFTNPREPFPQLSVLTPANLLFFMESSSEIPSHHHR